MQAQLKCSVIYQSFSFYGYVMSGIQRGSISLKHNNEMPSGQQKSQINIQVCTNYIF